MPSRTPSPPRWTSPGEGREAMPRAPVSTRGFFRKLLRDSGTFTWPSLPLHFLPSCVWKDSGAGREVQVQGGTAQVLQPQVSWESAPVSSPKDSGPWSWLGAGWGGSCAGPCGLSRFPVEMGLAPASVSHVRVSRSSRPRSPPGAHPLQAQQPTQHVTFRSQVSCTDVPTGSPWFVPESPPTAPK